jgi:hypothetical protein
MTAQLRHRYLASGASCLFSAKGAAFMSSLGQRPRLKSKIKSAVPRVRDDSFRNVDVGLRANEPVESRFQRLFISRSKSWGDAPGCREIAPLALNTHSDGALDPQ